MDTETSRSQEKLRKERAVLERQKSALSKLPTRKERAEVEAAEAVVEGLRKDSKAKDARHKLTVERMRRQIVTLQVRFLVLRVAASAPSVHQRGRCWLHVYPWHNMRQHLHCSLLILRHESPNLILSLNVPRQADMSICMADMWGC